MDKTSSKGTPDQNIAYQAKVWRGADKVAVADKENSDKQRAEYRARRKLAKTIDDAKEH